MASEIERKFLVVSEQWRDMRLLGVEEITQGYMAQSSDGTQPESRVRICSPAPNGSPHAFLTFKSNGDLVREEVELPVDLDVAHRLLAMCHGRVIYKTRHRVVHADKAWEVDVYSGPLSGLVVAEIELSSEDEAVHLPDWVGPELTHRSKFKNSRLVGMYWDGQGLSCSPGKTRKSCP